MKYTCIFCHKEFKTYQNLESHIRSKIGEKPYICQTCENSFSDPSNYNKHKKLHSDKTIKCEDCPHYFATQTLLRNHKKLKNLHRFQSEKCCCSFKYPYKLNIHLKKFHSAETIEVGNEVPTMDSVPATQADALEPESEDFPSQMGTTQMTSTEFKPPNADKYKAKPLNKRMHETETTTTTKKTRVTPTDCSATSHVEPTKVSDNQKVTSEGDEEDQVEDEEYIDYFASQVEDRHQSPTTSVIDNECNSSFAINENELLQQQKQSVDKNTQEDAHIMFILSSWHITKNARSCEKFIHLLKEKDNHFQKVLQKFLCGKETNKVSVQEMNKFLSEHPQEYFGKMITSVIVLEFVANLSLIEMINFLQSNTKNKEFGSLINGILHLLIQRRVRKQYSEFLDIGEIPDEIKANILIKDYFANDILSGRENELQLEQEARIKSEILKTLMQSMFVDLSVVGDSTNNILLDNTYTFLERSQIWQMLINEYVECLMTGKPTSSFETLLMILLREKVNVQVCFYVKSKNGSTPFYLHKEVLAKFVNVEQLEEATIVKATPIELDTFKKMLYLKFDPRAFIGRITYQLFKIARQLKFVNIGYFLFRGIGYEYYIRQNNKLDMFQIMISLKMTQQLESIASTFTIWFDADAIIKCLNGLPAEDVIYFLYLKTLNVDAITIYKIIIQWSHYKRGIDCNNELEVIRNEQTLYEFNKVRSVLPMMELESFLPQFVIQGFISHEDVSLVKAVKLSQFGFACRLPTKVWFRTEQRNHQKIN